MDYPSIGELIPQLANLAASARTSVSSTAGGQNFTHCCLVAINQSLTVTGPDGTLSFNTPSYFLPPLTIPELESVLSDDQNSSPCGVSPSDSGGGGTPVVRVPYDWCLSQCGGWEVSHLSVPQQWVGPLVLFILPSLAFCLNIPRAGKLATPDAMSRLRPRSMIWFATYWLRLLWAILLTVVDTLFWLSICFAFAGPMLLSAMYEYVLDRKVLEFLDASKEKGRRDRSNISSRLRAQLLLAVVVGNLRISTGRRMSVFSQWDAQTSQRRMSIGDILKDNTWTRVMAMIDEDELDTAWHGGKVLLSTKLKAILNSQARCVDAGRSYSKPSLFDRRGVALGRPSGRRSYSSSVASYIPYWASKTAVSGTTTQLRLWPLECVSHRIPISWDQAHIVNRVDDSTASRHRVLRHARFSQPQCFARNCLGRRRNRIPGEIREGLLGLDEK